MVESSERAVGDTPLLRKERGAFFTPPAIASFLTAWATAAQPSGNVLDPTCGDGVFLRAASSIGSTECRGSNQAKVYGIDLHEASLDQARVLVRGTGKDPILYSGDFFEEALPGELTSRLPYMDAVVGNPPFVRYQMHRGDARKRSIAAAWAQGVQLSGLASSWAALLVHAAAFLKPSGRLAMVLPAELLTVGYATPIRKWLMRRFASVRLVLIENLEFEDASEGVVLLLAEGTGGCDHFFLHQVEGASQLTSLELDDALPAVPDPHGKWTNLLVEPGALSVYREIESEHFAPLKDFGAVELGLVTGANSFFALQEVTRRRFRLSPSDHLRKLLPPGSKHLKGLRYTESDWQQQKLQDARVWLLDPKVSRPRSGLADYIREGERQSLNLTYKCSIRDPWWRPPTAQTPDLFFTYMSNVTPRIVANDAKVACVNSVHGIRLLEHVPDEFSEALPLVTLNSATMLGAELYGRAYGGGVLKMEPREAARLPVPSLDNLLRAWRTLENDRGKLDELARAGRWQAVVARVDQVLLEEVAGLKANMVNTLREAASKLRRRRTHRDDKVADL